MGASLLIISLDMNGMSSHGSASPMIPAPPDIPCLCGPSSWEQQPWLLNSDKTTGSLGPRNGSFLLCWSRVPHPLLVSLALPFPV